MFLIGVYLTYSKKKQCSGEYEIKPVLFLYAVGFDAATKTKTILKRKEKLMIIPVLEIRVFLSRILRIPDL